MIRILALILVTAGTALSVSAAEIFPRDSQWNYLKGRSEASTPDNAAWREIGFNDSSWPTGNAPFYYGEPLDGTQFGDMRNEYTSVYFRKLFTVDNPNALSQLQLDLRSDDGAIVWINGREVARFNMREGSHAHSDTSLPALAEPIPYERYLIENPSEFLVAGANVVAVHGFNSSISGSSDFVMDASLSGEMDETPPLVETLIPADRALVRALPTIEVIFNEGVTGVDASDLLINGEPASSLNPFGSGQYIFEFPEPATGTVEVEWIENHGIRDLSPAANPFGGGGWSYTFNPDAPLPGVIISEFLADNDNTLNDGDGDASDWIELFNAGEESADLDGWFLTDDINQPSKWRIPNVSIAPNSYLVIFASEKDRRDPAQELHTNFKLGADGEYLALVGPRTNIVSAFAPGFPPQKEDISYGRERTNPLLSGFFPNPTPGAPNAPGGPGFAPEIVFSDASRTFRTPFALGLSTASPEAVIRYEIGTNLPSETSPIYTGPIQISGTTQVRARAFEPGLLPGAVRSEMFIGLSGPVINFTSDLPIIILHNYGAGAVSASVDQFVMMEVFEPKNGTASLTNAPDLATRARFKRRGSSTQNYPKWSFAFEAWDEYGDDKKIELLGMPEESDWVFYAPNNFEPVLIHNPFIYHLSREVGQYASRTRFAEVYVNTGGGSVTDANYFGIYVIEEKIKRGADRVDVDKLEPEHLNPPEVTGGYMLKIDRPDPGDSPFSAAGQSINFVDPKGEVIRTAARDAQERYIRDYFNEFGQVLNGSNFADPVNGYAKYVDIPSWIDHHLLNVLAFNVDALRLSTYFYKPRGGKIVFGPIWDFDRALGSTDGRDSNPFVWRAPGGDRGTDFFNYPWWGRLFNDLEFWQKYIDRWQELRRDQFSLSNLNRIVDMFANEVRAAQPREQRKWGISPRGGSYSAEVQLMKNWLRDRVQFIDSQFLPAPTANQAAGMVERGTEVALSARPGSTIYYTLNGTDPRARGGGLAAGALTYSGPITVDSNVRIFARARNLSHRNQTGPDNPPLSTPWSGATIGTYAVEMPSLAITEIMYNPAPQFIEAGFTNQDFEYIELKNTGSEPINLGGAGFMDGIEFNFSETVLDPGDFILVVKNRSAFESAYGTGHRIAGEYAGSLNNAGETVELNGPFGVALVSFHYEPDWEPLTDGVGFSLVLRDENTSFDDYDLAASWTHGAISGGSPGTAEPPILTEPLVAVNEAVSRPTPPEVDWVELLNPGAETGDISGWYLTDDFFEPRKYRFPAGTVLDPGEYLVLDESEFNIGESGFAFGAEGEEVFLFSADEEGELTGYVHGFKFDASLSDMSFGRHVSSDGKDYFPRQTSITRGAANAGPTHGPVIINELMFYPPMDGTNDNTMDEFVELRNVSSSAVNLFDAAHPTNTWRLRGGVDFELPEGTSLPAGGSLLLVNFDPAANSTVTAAFRARYGLEQTVPVHGPYRGKLGNNGERVAILQPDLPDDDGSVPYVLVDEVNYSASVPWPEDASGTGSSLQRIPATFPSDPASWVAASPTAGKATLLPDDPDPDGDGLPTEWELAHGLDPLSADGSDGADGDPDADGLTNQEEHLSGTDPRDDSSYLHLELLSLEGGVRLLSFRAEAERSYSVLYRDSLEEGNWEKLDDISSAPEARTFEIQDDTAEPIRFYRLVTPAAP